MGEAMDDRPAGGIRASDAERDATVERLSRAAGDGRLTLEEFSQRMEQATAAKTRAELDRLVTDLPAEPAAAGASDARQGGPDMSTRPELRCRHNRPSNPRVPSQGATSCRNGR